MGHWRFTRMPQFPGTRIGGPRPVPPGGAAHYLGKVANMAKAKRKYSKQAS
jgi:hypothetical protein